jgi:hypothetical protein
MIARYAFPHVFFKFLSLLFIVSMCLNSQAFAQQPEKQKAADAKKAPDVPKDFLETPVEYFDTDVEKLISINTAEDVSNLRAALIDRLWGEPQLPGTQPASVIKAIIDERYNDITSLQQINKLVVKMEFGLESNVYLFLPKQHNGDVLLYHQGHGGDFYKSKIQIGEFLHNGYAVAAFSMPLLGMNNKPMVDVPRFGNLTLSKHDHLKVLTPAKGHPIKFFIEPIVVVLNYLSKKYDDAQIIMAGISGGGWTTTLAAAVDVRIEKSFPVAGSYPIYLRSNSGRDWGDYEQTAPEIYSIANYLELYILGSFGAGRKQVQLINQFDACCFAGLKWETYVNIVRGRVFDLGAGEYDLFLDDSHHEHMVSPAAMAFIVSAR